MNETKKETKNKINEAVEKPEFYVAKLGNIKYISTEKGVELLKQFQDMFDRMDEWEKQRQKYCKANLQNAVNSIRNTDEMVKVKIPLEDILGHTEYLEYITDRKGSAFLKEQISPDLLEEIQSTEAIENLTFIDGVILVREIFKRMIEGYFEDDEKDSHGCSYGAGLWDKMNDILDNNVLDQVQKHRAEDLHNLFEIRNDQYAT